MRDRERWTRLRPGRSRGGEQNGGDGPQRRNRHEQPLGRQHLVHLPQNRHGRERTCNPQIHLTTNNPQKKKKNGKHKIEFGPADGQSTSLNDGAGEVGSRWGSDGVADARMLLAGKWRGREETADIGPWRWRHVKAAIAVALAASMASRRRGLLLIRRGYLCTCGFSVHQRGISGFWRFPRGTTWAPNHKNNKGINKVVSRL